MTFLRRPTRSPNPCQGLLPGNHIFFVGAVLTNSKTRLRAWKIIFLGVLVGRSSAVEALLRWRFVWGWVWAWETTLANAHSRWRLVWVFAPGGRCRCRVGCWFGRCRCNFGFAVCLFPVVACLRDFSEVLKDAAGFFIFVSVFLFGGNAAGFGRGLPQRDPLPLSVGDASARGK